MSAPRVATRRKSAEERREEIVRIAIEHFAAGGYNGTSTEAVAREAGISQPYLFRLFGTKRELFLACHREMHERIRGTFEAAAHGVPREDVLQAMGGAYIDLLEDRDTLLFQMQSYAACSDPEIRASVRACYGDLVKLVGRLSGAEPHEVWTFFARGMLLNVTASLDLSAIADTEEWAACWLEPLALIQRAQGVRDDGAV
ncbi:MAG TPA: TetR/AcrR family transcriptional regulator [Solirubrobacteraceae bacterium]|nr:TetR/AcrR family transcriptional regulator [Solirubrobacteraceae bacterium]